MTIAILAFGIAKEIAGSGLISMQAEEGILVADLKKLLLSQYPRLGELTSFMIAVNNNYATPETAIQPGDEVAVIPPVSGG